jgi:hypothetical protein
MPNESAASFGAALGPHARNIRRDEGLSCSCSMLEIFSLDQSQEAGVASPRNSAASRVADAGQPRRMSGMGTQVPAQTVPAPPVPGMPDDLPVTDLGRKLPADGNWRNVSFRRCSHRERSGCNRPHVVFPRSKVRAMLTVVVRPYRWAFFKGGFKKSPDRCR